MMHSSCRQRTSQRDVMMWQSGRQTHVSDSWRWWTQRAMEECVASHRAVETSQQMTSSSQQSWVTANIGSALDPILHVKPLHRIGSMRCRFHVELKLYGFFCSIVFIFRSESILCPFKVTAADITWCYCHLKLDLYGVCRFGFTYRSDSMKNVTRESDLYVKHENPILWLWLL